MRVAIIILTWQRTTNLTTTLKQLSQQTHKDFDVYISNGNLNEEVVNRLEKYAKHFSNLGLRINLSHDGNEIFSFRRFTVGRDLAKRGYGVIMYLDDDITISRTYVSKCLSQYEPQTYKSGYAWEFYNKGKNYYKNRTRILDVNGRPHYCGTGVSMIDSSFFLKDKLFNYPKSAEKIEDLWLSYCVDQEEGWRLAYMDVGDVFIKGADEVALHREIMNSSFDKTDFLKLLIKMGWNLED